jgi:D-beta-D-heptose 7-phosphate kinase/D-beta-D-heptose 1-phosphate adenosyltransferase
MMNFDFSKAKILVVGDAMLDSYWQGATRRISPEAPVPVVHVNDQSMRIGGSGNVAMNVTSLGASASLLALIGGDQAGKDLGQLLSQSKIQNLCVSDPTLPTTTKLRVLSQHQQLIRLDFEQPHHTIDPAELLSQFEKNLLASNMVVLSDYGKGVLNDAQPYIQLANRQSIPVLVDPKKPGFENYAGAYLITPNQKEFEAVVGPWQDQAEMVSKASRVIENCRLQGLLITQGEKGMTLIMKDQAVEHFPAHAQEVYDVTGAGDTVIAALATGLASGMSVHDSVFLSCKAAAIVVGRVGTASVSVEDLQNLERSSSNKLSPVKQKIVDHIKLQSLVEQYKKQGKKVVFTNGCFDLLHNGHVRYLEQASTLGDVLIVAVNGDASVSRLKGKSRPINPLADRLEILAGLASVDLVVDFPEDTPEQLICSIKPDILVKGGDYEVEQIAGRQCAGEVVLIDFIKGKSSSNIMKKILDT